MAGYSGKPLTVKLGIKSGFRIVVLSEPAGLRSLLEPLPENVQFLQETGKAAGALQAEDIDIVLVFTLESGLLKEHFKASMASVRPAGMIWVCWPKRTAKAKTDLDENIVRDIGLELGWVDVKVCAVDEYWSGLKFVRRLKDR